MSDVDNFARSFSKIPKARRDESIHRALNLIPDENVILLADVRMDKSIAREIVETVYNDIINRQEDVKKISRQFSKTSHIHAGPIRLGFWRSQASCLKTATMIRASDSEVS